METSGILLFVPVPFAATASPVPTNIANANKAGNMRIAFTFLSSILEPMVTVFDGRICVTKYF